MKEAAGSIPSDGRGRQYVEDLLRKYKDDGLTDQEAMTEVRDLLEKSWEKQSLGGLLLMSYLREWATEKGLSQDIC